MAHREEAVPGLAEQPPGALPCPGIQGRLIQRPPPGPGHLIRQRSDPPHGPRPDRSMSRSKSLHKGLRKSLGKSLRSLRKSFPKGPLRGRRNNSSTNS